MTSSKVRVGLLVVGVSALIFVAVLAIHPEWPAKVIAPLLQRPIEAPTDEEYAVYSALIDDYMRINEIFHGSGDGVAYVTSKTMRMQDPGSVLPLDVAVFESESMGRDFYRQNSRSWDLEAELHTSVRIALEESVLRRSRLESDRKSSNRLCDFGDSDDTYGVFDFSRVGFNFRGNLALLRFSYRCAPLSGSGGWVVLERNGHSWHVKKYGPGWIS